MLFLCIYKSVGLLFPAPLLCLAPYLVPGMWFCPQRDGFSVKGLSRRSSRKPQQGQTSHGPDALHCVR